VRLWAPKHRHALQEPQIGGLEIGEGGLGEPDHREPYFGRGERFSLQCASGSAELQFEKPEGFTLAVDIV
jgi:hypothetical protein